MIFKSTNINLAIIGNLHLTDLVWKEKNYTMEKTKMQFREYKS